MFLLAAHDLAASVSDERLAAGALYPSVNGLREVCRRIAISVATEAGAEGDVAAMIDGAMWWPDYVPYVPLHPVDRRRAAGA
jgi:hypothetical protein